MDPGFSTEDPLDPVNLFGRVAREPPHHMDPNGMRLLSEPPLVCPTAATMDEVVRALQDMDATLVATSSLGRFEWGYDAHAFALRLLEAGDWKADLDGDGDLEPLLLDLSRHRSSGGVDWPMFLRDIDAAVGAVPEQLNHEIRFERLTLEVEGDTPGFVAQVDPRVAASVDADGKVTFRVLFRGVVPARADDQVFRLALNVVADDRDRVARQEILVVVPGRDAP
jgi:hypothetical protein